MVFNMRIQIYRLLERTKMAGPGWRFCIWVQGCSRHCKGCMAKETWQRDGGTAMDADRLLEQIADAADIEGITFLGGEPFEQPEVVAALAKQVRAKGLSTVIFTGFTYEELLSLENPHINRLLDATDLLIDGEFMEKEFDLSRPWVGSANQQFHFLTERYNECDLTGINNQIEVRISPNGKALVNGMGDFTKIKKLL
jgi:anaerobic ribonucleoside-triphosphate reductase activating protein